MMHPERLVGKILPEWYKVPWIVTWVTDEIEKWVGSIVMIVLDHSKSVSILDYLCIYGVYKLHAWFRLYFIRHAHWNRIWMSWAERAVAFHVRELSPRLSLYNLSHSQFEVLQNEFESRCHFRIGFIQKQTNARTHAKQRYWLLKFGHSWPYHPFPRTCSPEVYSSSIHLTYPHRYTCNRTHMSEVVEFILRMC